MPINDFHPVPVSDAKSKEIATRQLLSFLSLTDEEQDSNGRRRAPSKKLFSLSRIPDDAKLDAPPLFKWQTREIYDVDGALLFRDQILDLGGDNRIEVRTAANDLLRTPVWSVRAGERLGVAAAIDKAREGINDDPDLKPVLDNPEAPPKLICYAYPKLGILAYRPDQPDVRFVVDLWERTLFPVKSKEAGPPEDGPPAESIRTIWSPYDLVTRATVDLFRERFNRSEAGLPRMPQHPQQLGPAVAAARATIEERTTNPELYPVIGQQTNTFCAPATMAMILRHYSVIKSQFEIAAKMATSNVTGTEPVNQANAIDDLTENRLFGLLDGTASFSEGKDEIRANRPFKTGGISHARACCGFMIETNFKEWLYIYDPLPANKGNIYFEAWDADFHANYVYVRPSSSI